MDKYISFWISCHCASLLVGTLLFLCLGALHMWSDVSMCLQMFNVCAWTLLVHATQVVQISTRWMQSLERRWWLSGPTYRRRHWTCWLPLTRVSCRKTAQSGVRSPTHQEESFYQPVSFTALHLLIGEQQQKTHTLTVLTHMHRFTNVNSLQMLLQYFGSEQNSTCIKPD